MGEPVTKGDLDGLGGRVTKMEISHGKLETRVDGVEKDMCENGKILHAVFHKMDGLKESITDLTVKTAVSHAKLVFIAGGVTAVITFLVNKFAG